MAELESRKGFGFIWALFVLHCFFPETYPLFDQQYIGHIDILFPRKRMPAGATVGLGHVLRVSGFLPCPGSSGSPALLGGGPRVMGLRQAYKAISKSKRARRAAFGGLCIGKHRFKAPQNSGAGPAARMGALDNIWREGQKFLVEN